MSRDTVLSLFTIGGRMARVVMIIIMVSFTLLPIAAQDIDNADDAVAIFNEAQSLHEKGKLAEAIVLYEKAINILPEFPEAEYQRAAALQSLGRTIESEKGFRRAVELKPDWTLAMTSLGSLLVKKGETAEAEKLLKKVVEMEPQNSSALIALTDLRKRAKASPAVLQEMLTAITSLTSKMNPSASLWSARADLEIALGNTTAAKQSVVRSLAIDPKYGFALLQAANLAIGDGDIDRAKQIAARLEAINETPDAVNYLKANIAATQGNFDEAIKFLDAMKTPGTEAADLRSVINASRTTSPADLEKLLATDANNVQLLGRLCNAYRKDDPQKALAYCRRANTLEPTNVSHAVGYGAALVQAKQYDAAVNLLRNILQKFPDNRTAHANLATALFQLDRYAEAKPEFEWLTAKEPTLAGPYYFLAIAHDHLTEYMDAMANYQSYLLLADPVANKLDIEKINLRLPQLQKLIKEGKGKKN
ncbi:MAG: tetratricopeptide repeat protein [Chloracidobacterium sp.]|nr:tetratricopeptide repeat protein [Chloracidobacterium sp.]